MSGRGTEAFQGSAAALCDTVMVSACHGTPVQTHGKDTARTSPHETAALSGNAVSTSILLCPVCKLL